MKYFTMRDLWSQKETFCQIPFNPPYLHPRSSAAPFTPRSTGSPLVNALYFLLPHSFFLFFFRADFSPQILLKCLPHHFDGFLGLTPCPTSSWPWPRARGVLMVRFSAHIILNLLFRLGLRLDRHFPDFSPFLSLRQWAHKFLSNRKRQYTWTLACTLACMHTCMTNDYRQFNIC